MPDFLETTQQQIAARITDLQPLVTEHQRLQEALQALDSPSGPPVVQAPQIEQPAARRAQRRRVAPVSSARPATTTRRRGRRKGTGKRATQAVSTIQQHPGITAAELANRMGIKANYLYRVLPSLQKEGKITKDGRGWKPTTD